ncbi:MAG: hypothetical protein AAF430_07975 [Myxococcota bacterium]
MTDRMDSVLPMRQFHSFSFAAIRDRSRPLLYLNGRDVHARRYLEWTLMQEGYAPGYEFLSFPQMGEEDEDGERELDLEIAPEEACTEFDDSRMRPHDILVEPTRHPVYRDELVEPGQLRHWIHPGSSTLELRLRRWWEQFFWFNKREELLFTPAVAESLGSQDRAYSHVLFQKVRGARITKLSGPGPRRLPKQSCTLAVFARTRHVWADGPGLISAWSMEPNATAAFNWLLYHDLREFTSQLGFFVFRLYGPERRESPRGWLGDEIARSWRAEPLLAHRFDDEHPLTPQPQGFTFATDASAAGSFA